MTRVSVYMSSIQILDDMYTDPPGFSSTILAAPCAGLTRKLFPSTVADDIILSQLLMLMMYFMYGREC